MNHHNRLKQHQSKSQGRGDHRRGGDSPGDDDSHHSGSSSGGNGSNHEQASSPSNDTNEDDNDASGVVANTTPTRAGRGSDSYVMSGALRGDDPEAPEANPFLDQAGLRAPSPVRDIAPQTKHARRAHKRVLIAQLSGKQQEATPPPTNPMAALVQRTPTQ